MLYPNRLVYFEGGPEDPQAPTDVKMADNREWKGPDCKNLPSPKTLDDQKREDNINLKNLEQRLVAIDDVETLVAKLPDSVEFLSPPTHSNLFKQVAKGRLLIQLARALVEAAGKNPSSIKFSSSFSINEWVNKKIDTGDYQVEGRKLNVAISTADKKLLAENFVKDNPHLFQEK